MRRCIGCYQSKPQSELLRLTYNGSVFIADTDARNEGRGIYLCRNEDCIKKSFKRKAWNRICRSAVNTEDIMRVIDAALSETKEDMNVKKS
jgi:hypothetical protein